MRADLHTHSNASDGTESPAELVRQVAAAGITTFALTDHDTTAGWTQAAEAARQHGVRLIPGIEFSSLVGPVSVHILGYMVDPQHTELLGTMNATRESRLNRARRIVERIGADYRITWEDVLRNTSDGATVGRPHIADALVELGLAADRNDAFAGILHSRAGYVIPHEAPTPVEAVQLITQAGGLAVIAHPGTKGPEALMPEEALEALVAAGLFGIEVDHPENREDAKPVLRARARRFGLVTTGSSDYHGTGKVNRLGDGGTEDEIVEEIIRRATGARPVS